MTGTTPDPRRTVHNCRHDVRRVLEMVLDDDDDDDDGEVEDWLARPRFRTTALSVPRSFSTAAGLRKGCTAK